MKQALFYVFLVALLGAFIATLAGHSDIQNTLSKSAASTLREDAVTATLLDKVKIEFRGQEAFVSGDVESENSRDRLAATLLTMDVPARFGRSMPGVTAVHVDGVRVGTSTNTDPALESTGGSER